MEPLNTCIPTRVYKISVNNACVKKTYRYYNVNFHTEKIYLLFQMFTPNGYF